MIAVIYFPGNNCEVETKRALEAVNLKAEIVRWNSQNEMENYQGYVLCGGWSYEDRIRAGVIASRDPLMNTLKSEAKKGKPVLGICNGAQVLVESGIVPDTQNKMQNELALAPNQGTPINGYYCTWTKVKVQRTNTAFTGAFDENEIISMPIAHAEGRFTPTPSKEHIALTYCDEKGNDFNLNGQHVAAITNKKGNAMAIMPHPERACFTKQLPYQEQKTFEGMLKHAKAMKVFESIKDYVGGQE